MAANKGIFEGKKNMKLLEKQALVILIFNIFLLSSEIYKELALFEYPPRLLLDFWFYVWKFMIYFIFLK